MHKRKFRLILSAVLYSLFIPAVMIGQQTVSVIPYELLGGKMIVNIQINNKTERIIFDTGAEKSALTNKFVKSRPMPVLDSIQIRDVNNRLRYFAQSRIDSISTCDNQIMVKNLYTSVVDGETFMECFDAIGLLGSDFLVSANLICIIDGKTRTITLTSAEKRVGESLRYAHNFVVEGFMPRIEMAVNGEPVIALFDSGCPSFLQINKREFNRLDSMSLIKTIDVGGGRTTLGVGGGSTKDVVKAGIDNFRIGLAKFSNVVAITNTSLHPLLGMGILNYGKVVIDYPRRLFYYIPFSNETVTLGHTSRKFELKVLMDGKLRVATVWSEMADVLSTDDLVTHINGKPTATYDYCASLTKGLEELKGKGPFLLTIQTKEGKEVEVEF